MDYYWLDCPRCNCQVVINVIRRPGRISGSLRRWSADRTTNDGRKLEVAAGAADGPIPVPCVCGQDLALPASPSAVGTERDPDLRVTLG